MKPGYGIFKRLVAEPLGQAAIRSNIEEAQRGMVSTIDTIDLDGDEEIDIRGWIRAFGDRASRSTSASTPASATRTAATSPSAFDPQRQLHPDPGARNADEYDLLLTSRRPARSARRAGLARHFLSSVDSERDALTGAQALFFLERIHVQVIRRELKPTTASIWPASGS